MTRERIVDEQSVKYVTLALVREQMDGIPFYPCPVGFRLRTFRPGDERSWARIEVAVGEFAGEDEARRRFEEFYEPLRSQLEDRLFILESERGEAVGTASAWQGELMGESRGRVIWVAIAPEYQGRGLGKPLLSAVMARLASEYSTAFLTTQTTSFRAVNLYLSFGFAPFLMEGESREGWEIVEAALGRTILSP